MDSILVFGDSRLENSLEVAKGFPNVSLTEDEIVLSRNFYNYLDRNDAVTITIDLAKIIEALDENFFTKSSKE